MIEKRHSHRIPFDCLVEFKSENCRYICELVDISLQGALIAACTGATPGYNTPCQLIISLDKEKEIQIIMTGIVARKIENRLGIHCESIDVDSMTYLRKLVELNLGDVKLANRDFDAMLHEHNQKTGKDSH